MSLLIHGALILLLILASRTPRPELIFDAVPTGAGGINLPMGGGGGGTLGAGGRPTRPERAQFIQVAPPPKVPEPEVRKEPVKPVVPTPQLVKPEPVVVPPPVIVPPVVPTTVMVASAGTIDSSLTGRGGGTGADGTTGSGPGRGGGIGSGDGTGTGSGTGPGTGGGSGNVFQPTLFFTPIPPSDVPNKVKPYEMIALFDVDATGEVLGFKVNPSGDRGLDRDIDALLKTVKFRPAVDLQGRPVRATYQLTFVMK